MKNLLPEKNFKDNCLSATLVEAPADKMIYEYGEEINYAYAVLKGQLFELNYDDKYEKV